VCKYPANKDTKMALATITHLSLHMLMAGEVMSVLGTQRLINQRINHKSISLQSENERWKTSRERQAFIQKMLFGAFAT